MSENKTDKYYAGSRVSYYYYYTREVTRNTDGIVSVEIYYIYYYGYNYYKSHGYVKYDESRWKYGYSSKRVSTGEYYTYYDASTVYTYTYLSYYRRTVYTRYYGYYTYVGYYYTTSSGYEYFK